MTAGRALVWAGAVLASTACGGSVERACPAIGWSNQLTVQLAEGWPPGEGRWIRVECASACGWEVRRNGSLADRTEVSAPLDGPTARIGLEMTAPGSVVVTVLGPDGADLAEPTAELDWVRVGGSAECGGPHEATVTVPAP